MDAAQRVVFDAHNIVGNGPDRVFTSVLYFRTDQEFINQLATAGFTKIAIHGDWEHGPVTDACAVLVVHAAHG